MSKDPVKKTILLLELAAAALVIYFDLFLPTIVIAGIAIISILLKKEQLAVLGFRSIGKNTRMVLEVLALAVVWTLINFAVTLPVLNHIAGTARDLSAYKDLKGNVGQLLLFLTISWTLAALGEETVYRGFLQARIRSLFQNERIGMYAAVAISSALFGLAHIEQGIVGVVVTTTDAIFFSVLRYRYKTLWACVLAHGFMNSIGIITFFFTGPLYGLW